MTFSAIGDALGWPTELGRYPGIASKRFGKPYLQDFIEWDKTVGGRFWGYREKISEGSYSDDTQLTLSVTRCIDESGDFDADKFAYFELPLWLAYERGGGRSIKTAARSIIQTRREWKFNFYKRGNVIYRNAGANGAAMRVLPIGLVNINSGKRLYRDAFLNAIVTHGHPRAILGSVLYASTANYLLSESKLSCQEFYQYLREVISSFSKPLVEYDWLHKWIQAWDEEPVGGLKFRELFHKTRSEASKYLEGIEQLIDSDNRDYYNFTGALSPSLKGSGISTVFVAIYLFRKYLEDPLKGVLTAVNMRGSDTDTIANFVGGLFGAYYGLSAVPSKLLNKLQDKDYILKVASQLYGIIMGESLQNCVPIKSFDRRGAFLRILAWEIGLHEMFWDALSEGDSIIHPILGRGIIRQRMRKPIAREGYQVKLVKVAFDCGQTCTFHSRVGRNGEVDESLSKDLIRNSEMDISLEFRKSKERR